MKKLLAVVLILMLSISCTALEKEKYSNEPFKKVTGGWESTAKGGSYLVLKEDGTFYWYGSSTHLNDNYLEGSYTLLNGQEAVDYLKLPSDNIKELSGNDDAKASLEDIYSANMKTTRLTQNGEDKTDTIDKNEMDLLIYYQKDDFLYVYNYLQGKPYTFKKNDIYKEK